MIYPVKEWAKIADLEHVRKAHLGRHRMYLTGLHTDCHYCLVLIKPFKRREEDKPETPGFQGTILRALEGKETPVLYAPSMSTDCDE
jgi:hypothetical protein